MQLSLQKGNRFGKHCAEPEITNLVQTLKSMGASIEEEGTGVIRIKGVDELHDKTIVI